MRIACVHLPQFALQTLTRVDPSLRGAAVAVVGSGAALPELDRSAARLALTGTAASGAARARAAALYTPVVHAVSRAAWALGVRLGMTATAANTIAPGELRVVTTDPQLEREAVRAIADALLGATSVVDVGGRVGAQGPHLAVYCEVPTKTRGAAFGDRLVELLAGLGLMARVGIADDRFTAWVAAAHGMPGEEGGVLAVPRGGSAAFLSPRPLSLLSITPEVQHMLGALGVNTLGEFAALPAPSVARPFEADFQALARGESGHALRAYAPEAPIREDIALSVGVEHGVSTSAAVALLAERAAIRLAGRARGAARLEVTISSASGEKVVPITPGVTRRSDHATSMAALASGTVGRRVIESPDEIADALALALTIGLEDQVAPWRMRLAITAEAIAGDELGATAVNTNVAANDEIYARAEATAASLDLLGVVLSSTGTASEAASSSGAWRLTAVANGAHDGHPTTSLGHARTLRDERRDAHRRTQSGKQRARRQTAPDAQVRMFADRK